MSRLPKKTLFKCTTSLSINERFTQLRGVTEQATVRLARQNTIRENNALVHQASIKNRRLAQQMERRPTVMAALKLKKKSIRQRLGPLDNVGSVQDRLLLPGPRGLVRGRGRGLGRGTPLRGRIGLQGRVSVLASPRGIRSFAQRSRGGVLLRQPQRNLEIRQQRSQLLGQLRENRLGIQQSRGRLRGSQLRGSGLRGQLRTSLPRGSQFRTNQLGGRLRGTGLRGTRLRGTGLRSTGLRDTGLRGTRLRGTGLRGTGLRGRGLRGTGLRRGGISNTTQLRGSGYRGSQLRRGQGQSMRGQMRGGQVQRYQRGRGYQQGFRGVRGIQQRFRGSQQSNQRASFRGFGRNQYNQTKPSKEELDNELDQYMSNSESYTRHNPASSWH